MENDRISDRIKLLRKSKQLSQSDFARKIDVTHISVGRMERGENKPRNATIASICNAFGVSRDWLLYGEGEMEIASVPDVQAEKNSSQKGESIWERALLSQLREQNSHLKKEVQFLREMLKGFAKNMDPANFNEAFDAAGVFIDMVSENLVKSGRVLKQCA